MGNDRTPKEMYLHTSTYSGPQISVTDAKEIMSKFSADSTGSVDLETPTDGIAKICVNNPRTRNAINVKMMFDFNKVVDELNQWTECKGVILYGAGGHFCSGGDLNNLKEIAKPEIGNAMATFMNDILEKLRKLPTITVAYIEGVGALGGGAELTTACDYRLMCSNTPNTVLGFVHGKMGIVPAWGSTGRLISIVGQRKAMDLLLESRPLGVIEAMNNGLVDGTVATLSDAIVWLSQKIRQDVNVIKAIKRTRLCYNDELDWQAATLMERKIYAPLWGGPSHLAALEHFKHKN